MGGLTCIHMAIFYVSQFILLTLEQYQIIAITTTRPRRGISANETRNLKTSSFKYAFGEAAIAEGVSIDGWLRMGLLPPP